jgi:hypothetical protein
LRRKVDGDGREEADKKYEGKGMGLGEEKRTDSMSGKGWVGKGEEDKNEWKGEKGSGRRKRWDRLEKDIN